MTSVRLLFVCFVSIFLLVENGYCTNGMNMIGYSVRSSSMGGADVAVDNDCSGSTCNPATQGKLSPKSMSVGFSSLMPQLSLKGAGGDVDGENQKFALPYLTYVHHLDDSPWTLGVNVYAQGGMGVDFRQVQTFAGTVDSLQSQVSYLRMSGTASYRVGHKLSIGAGVMVGYADMEFSFFPNTYSPGRDKQPGTRDDFMGVDAKELQDYGIAARFGLQYKVTDFVNVGFQYTSEASLDPSGGSVAFNFGSRTVTYDAEMNGFTWPREVEFGVAIRAIPELLVATDIKWLNWASAMNVVQIQASNPDFPVPLRNIETQFDMNWDDQWVLAIGAEYSLKGGHILRCGYNYGKNPIPDENLNPLFPAITEHHLTFGYGYLNLAKGWGMDFGWEHAFENSETNPNPGVPGPTISHSQNTLHAVVTWYF